MDQKCTIQVSLKFSGLTIGQFSVPVEIHLCDALLILSIARVQAWVFEDRPDQSDHVAFRSVLLAVIGVLLDGACRFFGYLLLCQRTVFVFASAVDLNGCRYGFTSGVSSVIVMAGSGC